MGITYIFDVTCAFVNMRELGPFAEYTEIIWDCINCSQGKYVNLFSDKFCLKKSTWCNHDENDGCFFKG